ncbi:MFS transporter [Dactylosporangium fulvum]|uniref:MFS transporter n=1 Tax=Dactylosporangium fulvum TaxID=53359 RepID=A0ABY5VPD4_9ACTN|nr:MFS transporter [Dactylosporangium fulvum]UWP78646.1 MFS transporter [Dactylosporangium fulvum]
MSRTAVGWALLADALPLYPLYALFFVDAGLTEGQVSLLFALWSGVGIVAEVPTGALADRWSRRNALVVSALVQGAGFAVWLGLPGFWGFAAGFVLWGVGGALASGALEALLYDGLAAAGAEREYVQVSGRVNAAGLVAQVPAAAAAAVLFPVGGFALVGWVSVGICLVAVLLALRLPETAERPGTQEPKTRLGTGLDAEPGIQPDIVEGAGGRGYLATLRDGVREAAGVPAVRTAVLALAALAGLDAVEEYFPLIAAAWDVPTGLNPVVGLVVTVGGAAGAWAAGRAGRLGGPGQGLLMVVAAGALAVAGWWQVPSGMLLVAGFYGLYRLVLVLVDARLQRVIESRARATVTSVAALATQLSALALFAAWAAGGLTLVAALTGVLALVPLAARKDAAGEGAPPPGG